jgi:hypothetical protein
MVKGFGWWLFFIAAVEVSLSVVRPLDAASFTLTPQEREEAIQLGKRSVVNEEFGSEWTVGGDEPGQAVTVMTPFYRLALAARHSAFKNQELKQKDIETLLRNQEGTLTLWTTLTGGKTDFARFYAPVLVNGQRQIKASFSQNERTARREEDGSYTARCLYVFGAESLKPNDKLVLIVKDSGDKQVAKFTLDLSVMR